MFVKQYCLIKIINLMQKKKDRVFIGVKVPKSLKSKILAISYKRKVEGKPNSTQNGVAIELLEAGLLALSGNKKDSPKTFE